MDNYEVNVLTRKGGWKKLPQEVLNKEEIINKEDLNSTETEVNKEFQLNVSDNLNIHVTEDSLDSNNPEDFSNNLFENFTEVNNIIKKLKTIEKEKNILINELNELMKDFQIRKNNLDKKLSNIEKEKEMYDKAINLISSLKNI